MLINHSDFTVNLFSQLQIMQRLPNYSINFEFRMFSSSNQQDRPGLSIILLMCCTCSLQIQLDWRLNNLKQTIIGCFVLSLVSFFLLSTVSLCFVVILFVGPKKLPKEGRREMVPTIGSASFPAFCQVSFFINRALWLQHGRKVTILPKTSSWFTIQPSTKAKASFPSPFSEPISFPSLKTRHID